MALVNDAKREINAKIVYMGGSGSGKGASLRYIYSKLKPEYRSDLKVIPAGEHQMLFFDFIYPQASSSSGYTIRFHLYTLLAGNSVSPPWKMLIKGADGLVFLADAAKERLADNIHNAGLLRESMAHHGMNLSDTPLSLQVNCSYLKSPPDVSGILSEIFHESGFSGRAVDTATGERVLEELHSLIKLILARLGQNPDETVDEPEQDDAEPVIPLSSEPIQVTADNSEANLRYHIEIAGEAVCDRAGGISLPLRFKDSTGGATSVVTLKISLSL